MSSVFLLSFVAVLSSLMVIGTATWLLVMMLRGRAAIYSY